MPNKDKSKQGSETPIDPGETAKKQSKLRGALALYSVLHNIARRANETPEALQEEKPEALAHQRGFLKPEDQYALASTCTTLFEPFKKGREARIVSKLLLCVAHGDQDKVEKLLKEIPSREGHPGSPAKPEWLLARGDVTDLSGRVFKNITAFEYALWAMDTHMIRMMLDSLPKDEKGEAVRVKLLEQYELAVMTLPPIGGVEYTFKGTRHRENHFNFEPLRAALKTYIEQYISWSEAQIAAHWCTVVGGAQADVPMHVAQEYCQPTRSFDPTPQFNETEKLSRGMPKIYNYLSGNEEGWWPGLSQVNNRLGVGFGIFRGRTPAWVAVGSVPAHGGGGRRVGRGVAIVDLAAVDALCKVRTDEVIDLRRRLQEPLQKPDAGLAERGVVQ
jgi:hypothetical protein